MWVRGVAVVVGLMWGLAPAAGADVFCKTKKGAVKVRAACKAKETQLNLADFGAAGPPGTDGADGQLRIFGDGSAGARTVAVDETWEDATAPTNPQFTDVTVNSGVTLTVPSGTVIRCTGTFANNGMIVVQTGGAGAFFSSTPLFGNTFGGVHVAGEAGVSRRAAQSGAFGDASEDRRGGVGGLGLTAEQARTILHPGMKAGGGGGAGGSDTFLGTFNTGSDGGGSLVVLCQGAVTNNGTITADGDDSTFELNGMTIIGGGGGGGGGVVVLASKTQVTNGATGTIFARGGAGQDSDTNEGPSGGGGGGIIHLLAPTVSEPGAEDVAGGAAGAQGAAASVTTDPRGGGGGGGGSGGNGGAGGGVTTADTPGAASAGGDGFVVTTTADPTALF